MRSPTNTGIWGCLAALLATAAGCAVHRAHPSNGTSGDGGNIVAVPNVLANAATPTAARTPQGATTPPPSQSAVFPAAFQTPDKPGGDPTTPAEKGKANSPTGTPATPAVAKPDQPAAAPTGYTLDQLVNATLLADPKLRAGFEAINQSHGDALTASLRPNPTFGISQTLMPLTRPFTVDAQGGPPQLDVGIGYSVDWFLFGKRAAAMQAAGLGVKVSESDYADLVRQRVLDASTGYYDVLEAKSLVELAKQDVENLTRIEAVTEKSVQAGNRPQVDLNRIRLDRLKSEQAVRDADNGLVVAKAKLRALLGHTDADPSFDVAGKLDEMTMKVPAAADEAFAAAVENRPDLVALRWKVSQAQAGTVVEYRKAYPEMTPKIGYTRQFQQTAIGFPDASSFGFGLDMTLPLFDRNQGNRRKATSVVAQSTFELQAALVALRAEVVQADQDVRTAAANAAAVAGEQLKVAGEVRETISQSYAAGNRPLLDVLDAQRNYRDTYRLFITGRASYGRAVVKYFATLGKPITP